MTEATPDTLPACGLYRTGIALPGHEEQVGDSDLVYFHNHSDQGPPMVLTPHANEHNRWKFHDRGWSVDSPEFVEAMVALKPEGLYICAHHLHVTREEIIPERTLVQLGYNRSGESILFVGRFEGNAITFPDSGYSFRSPEIQERLEPVTFSVPQPIPLEKLQ